MSEEGSRGHQHGAFGNMNRPHNHHQQPSWGAGNNNLHGQSGGTGHRANNGGRGYGKQANRDLGKELDRGLSDNFGKGLNAIGKRDPGLDALNDGLKLGRNMLGDHGHDESPVMGASKGQNPAPKDPVNGADNQGQYQSPNGGHGNQGNDRDRRRPDSRPGFMGNGNRQAVLPGLRDRAGKLVPGALQKLGGQTGRAYHKLTVGISHKVTKVAKKFHVAIGTKAAISITHGLMAGVLAIGVFAGAYSYENRQRALYSGDVCAVQNTGDESYAGTESGGTQGGAWTQEGSKEYNNAKAVAKKLKSMGFSGVAIAGIMGNMAQESGFRTEVLNGTGDGGKGLMQWTGGRRAELESFAKSKGMDSGSLKLQLLMMENDLKKASFWVSAYKKISPKILNHASSPADAAMRFYLSQFEAGGGWATDPDGSGSNRQAFAQQAYTLFHLSGIKGSDSKVEALVGGDASAVANENSAVAEGLNNAQCKGDDGGPAVAGKWGWPFDNFNPDRDVDSGFGPRALAGSPWHDGIDVGTAHKTGDLKAIHGGTVKEIGLKGTTQFSIGYYIAVESPDGWSEIYQEFAFSESDGKAVTKVHEGQNVKTGETIAEVKTSTPQCTHVHIGVYHGSVKEMMSKGQADWQNPHGQWNDPVKIIKKGLGGDN